MDYKRRAVTTGNGKDEERNPNTAGVDRISTLSNTLIHRILSSVSTVDVVRMSILSKRWSRMWYTVPHLRFYDSDAGFRKWKVFDNFMAKCLERREIGMSNNTSCAVTKFKLHIKHFWCRDENLHRLLHSPVIRNNVEELDLSMEPKYNGAVCYCLPYTALNGKSITVLKLNHVELEDSDNFSVNLPSLKSLCLEEVIVNDVTLSKLLLGCPSLEKLMLKKCPKLFNPRILSSSLKFFEMEGFIRPSHKELQVEAINLQTLVLRALYHGLNLCECSAVRTLSIHSIPNMRGESLEAIISKLPLLEDLSLRHCDLLRHFKISSKSLKSFTFAKFSRVEVNATLETPNLVSFCYTGDMKFGVSMALPNDSLMNGHIKINDCIIYEASNLYNKMIKFLSSINFSWNILTLEVRSEELRKTCGSPLTKIRHLKVKTLLRLNKKTSSDLRDSLHWASPDLETLDIEDGGKGDDDVSDFGNWMFRTN
ncbi:Putative FBD-associated F-box protein [Morus notabilis]|uniref:Putative FBD-associated F-box protein n=1 Tax=Morus notabilis TaxID=981085 RepID=W9R468_9ROSA|nr:Putative FBD-associated F-box protein [Morus notabilis]